jgi:hypothetical protein
MANLFSSNKTKGAAAGSAISKEKPVPYVFSDALDTVYGQIRFRRDYYRFFLKTALILSIVIGLGLVSIIGIIVTATPKDRFFTSSVSGRNERVYPADEPFNDQAVQLIARAVISAMSFSFSNYQVRFTETGQPFLPLAFTKLTAGVMGSGGMDAVINQEISYETTFDSQRPMQIISSVVGKDLVFESVIDIPVNLAVRKVATRNEETVTPYLVRAKVRRSLDLSFPFPFMIIDIDLQPIGPGQTKKVAVP